MLNEKENVVEETTENVEATTEETTERAEDVSSAEEKVYTESEFKQKLTDGINRAVSRREGKIRKQFDDEYGELSRVLKAGTGEDDLGKITEGFKNYYEGKGKKIPTAPQSGLSNKEIKILADAEAGEIIDFGDEEVDAEYGRLARLGIENMTAKDKAVFEKLSEYKRNAGYIRELSKIGVSEDVYNSAEFKNFASKFNSDTPITDIYNIYSQTIKPQKQVQQMGSMKSTTSKESDVKDYYSYEEASKFTNADFEKNPKLFEAVKNSMRKWK